MSTTQSTTQSSTAFKVEQPLAKALFDKVEKSGIHRTQFDLAGLCNTHKFIFGEPGDEKRRAIQKLFGEAKRKKKAQNYANFIKQYGTVPGPLLQAELDEEQNQPAIDQPAIEEGTEMPASGVETFSDDNSISDSSTSVPATKSRTKSKKKSTAPTNSIVFKTKSPSKKMKSQNDDASSYTTVESYASTAATEVMRRVKWLEQEENMLLGTEDKPYIVIADPDRPETSWGFEVAMVPNIKVGNFVRSVFHLRKTTTQGQEDEWSAIVPSEKYPVLAKRSILVRGPSQDDWHRHCDLYHEDEFCSQTATIHEAQQTAINGSLTRRYSFWLIVLPEGVELENYIISHDSIHIKKNTQEMTQSFEVENDAGAVEYETLYGMDVNWRIAIAGGKMVTDPGSAGKKRRKKKTPSKA